MKKRFHLYNISLLICSLLCLVTYDIFGGLWLKGVTSSFFVVLSLINFIYAYKMKITDKKFILLIICGLFLGMCADVLLGITFMLGIISFALGHVVYLIAFYSLEKFQWKELFVIIPICIISLYIVVGTPFIQINDPVLKKMLIGYAIIIACMVSKAMVNLYKERSLYRVLIFIGSIMFYFSDIMLAIDLFNTSTRLLWILCSYTYWPAQNILAYSLYHYINHKKEMML